MFYSSINPGGTRLSEIGKSLLSSKRPKKKKAKLAKQPAFNQKAFGAYFVENYLPKRTTPAAPPSRQCPPVGGTTGTIAAAKETADAVVRAGQVRRAEVEPVWVPPAQPVKPVMTAQGILKAAEKARSPMQAPPMDPMAQAIILAGQRRRGEV